MGTKERMCSMNNKQRYRVKGERSTEVERDNGSRGWRGVMRGEREYALSRCSKA